MSARLDTHPTSTAAAGDAQTFQRDLHRRQRELVRASLVACPVASTRR